MPRPNTASRGISGGEPHQNGGPSAPRHGQEDSFRYSGFRAEASCGAAVQVMNCAITRPLAVIGGPGRGTVADHPGQAIRCISSDVRFDETGDCPMDFLAHYDYAGSR
jgi:hypothetical protein